MSFMVNFRSAEGKLGYHPTESLEEAIRFVEHLRNQEHVVDARVWRLQEVPLEVKTYYKVEIAPAEPVAAAAAKVDEEPVAAKADGVLAGAAAPASTSTSTSGDAAGAVGPNGARFGRFNRT
jgi:hypothetical protein